MFNMRNIGIFITIAGCFLKERVRRFFAREKNTASFGPANTPAGETVSFFRIGLRRNYS